LVKQISDAEREGQVLKRLRLAYATLGDLARAHTNSSSWNGTGTVVNGKSS